MYSALAAADSSRDTEYIVVVHASRIATYYDYLWAHSPLSAGGSTWGRFTVVVNYDRDCLVDQCNAAALAARGEIIVGNQDDMRFPEHWDTEILKLIPDTSARVCLQAQTDGARPDLLTIPTIATRVLLDAMGPISPEYESMYCDDDQSEQLRRLGTVLPCDLYFRHLHPANGTAHMDDVYAQENREEAYRIGQQVFWKRKAAGFPRVELPGWPPASVASAAVKSEVSDYPGFIRRLVDSAKEMLAPDLPPAGNPRPTRKMVLCLPTPNFEEVGNALQIAGKSESLGFEVNALPGYTSSPDVTRMGLAESALKFWGGDPLAPYVLWKDDDNLVLPEQLERLIRFLDNTPRADIVVGWCWIKHGESYTTSAGRFRDNMHVEWLTLQDMLGGNAAGDPLHIARLASGFPCVLMRRQVLEKLGPRAFVKIPRDDFQYGAMGEDFSFFWRAHEAGFCAYIDPLCKVGHIKPELQEPDLKLPPGGELPPIVEKWRQGVNGNRVEVPMG